MDAIGRSVAARAISRSGDMNSGNLLRRATMPDAELSEDGIDGGGEATHVVRGDGTDAAHAEARRRRVVEIADQEAARFQCIDEALQRPSRIGRRMHVHYDRPLDGAL